MICDNDNCHEEVDYDNPIAEIGFKMHGQTISEFVYCSKECAAEDLANLTVEDFGDD